MAQISNRANGMTQSRLTVSKCHNLVHGVKDDRMFKHAVVVKLAKIFHLCDAPLVEPVIVLLETKSHRLDYVVNHLHHKCRMIAIERAEQDTEEVDAPILDLSRL